MSVNIYQFIVSIPLFLALAFGLGFIINMILKTTWAPIYMYIVAVVILAIRVGDVNSLDAIVVLAGLIGAFLSGYVIRLLRKKGFRMF